MLLLVIPLLAWQREWKTLIAFSIAAGLFVLCSVAVAGPEALIAYPRFLMQSTGFDGHGVATEDMFGLNGLVSRLTGDPTPSNLWLVAFAPLLLLLVLDAWRRAPVGSAQFPLALGATLSATLLLNPHLYFQDMVMAPLAIAFGVYVERQSGQRTTLWIAMAAAIWLLQLINFSLARADINLLTPLVIGLLLTSYLRLRASAGTKVVHDLQPRESQITSNLAA
jgi:hypothetical protein